MPNNFSLDQIYLTNETYAFYTFSNPIFDSFDVQELRDCSIDDELHVQVRRGSTSREDLGAMKSNTEEGGSQSDGRGYNRQPEACSSSRLLLISDAKQKWAIFCDNFAFSVRNKLFVMETNFKRRLRALRRFLDKKLPQRLLQAASSENKLSKQERLAAKSFVRRPNLDELLKLEQNQQRNRTSRLLNLSEPISAKALGAQQEHILSRLERIKRDNQRLASSSSCSSIGLVHQQSCPSDRQDQQRIGKTSGKTKAVKFGCWPAESQSRQAGWRMPKSASSPSQMTIPFCLARAQGQELDSVCSSASTSSSEALTDSPAASTSSCKAAPATDAAKTTTASATERPKPTASRVRNSLACFCCCLCLFVLLECGGIPTELQPARVRRITKAEHANIVLASGGGLRKRWPLLGWSTYCVCTVSPREPSETL